MSQKTSSFLVPFSISFFSIAGLGLAILYFGYYRPKFTKITVSANTTIVASPQFSKPILNTKKNDSFSVDESGVVRGNPDTDESKSDSHQLPFLPKQTRPKATSSQNTAQHSSSQNTTRDNPPTSPTHPASSAKIDSNSKHQSSSADKPIQPDNSDAEDKQPDDPKAMNNGGNNLMRALQEAGKRKQQTGASATSDVQTTTNPFESILKSRAQVSGKSEEETDE